MERRPAGNVSGAALDALVRGLRSALGLLDLLAEGVALYATDGTVVFSNAAAYRLIGAQRGGVRHMHFSAHIAPAERERVAAQFEDVVRFARGAEFETRFAYNDGSPVEVMVRLAPAFARDAVVGVYGIATDVTVQNAVERRLLRSQQQFRSLFEHHPNPITMLDAQGKYERINRAAETIGGFLNEEVVGKPTWAIVAPDRIGEAEAVRAKSMRGESTAFETTIVSKDGRTIDVQGVTIPIVIDGAVQGYFSASRDVTERRRTRADLARQSERIHQLYRVAASPGATTAEQIRNALKVGLEQLGFTWAWVAHVDGGVMTIVESVGAEDRIPVGFSAEYEQSFLRHAVESGDIFFVDDLAQPPWNARPHPSGRGWRSYLGVPLKVAGEPYGALGFTSDEPRPALAQTDRDFVMAIVALTASAIERGLQERRLDALAFYDSLTGLPNRALLMDRLEQFIGAARRRRTGFATHFIDFDGFKSVNDTYGHAGGDAMLVAMSARLKSAVRESDTLARLGGDEFVVLQSDVGSAGDARDFACRIAAAFEAPFAMFGASIAMHVSIGISLFPDDGLDPATLLRRADRALYRVKQGGRGGIRTYDAALDDGD